MKAKVVKRFRDRVTKDVYEKGSVYEGIKERVYEIRNKGFVEIEANNSLLEGNVKEVNEKITERLTLDELKALLHQEEQDKNRTGVKNRIESFIQKLDHPNEESE